MDVSRAQLSNLGDGVVLVDPEWPWTVCVRMSDDPSLPGVISLTLTAREEPTSGGVFLPPITSTVLSQLPMRQLGQVAASALAGEGEAQLRMLARPRPRGSRSWPPDHYARVARVAAWARQTQRPGGAAGAVSEFWNVHYRTARRWLAQLR
jgi:hypothetical protein